MKTITAFLLLMIPVLGFSQEISYQVLEDQPEKAYTKFVAPEFGMEYNSPDLSVFIGVNARYGLTDLLTLEGIGRFDLYHSSGDGPTFLFEAGGFLPLTSKIKNKEVPIVLSYNPYAGTTYKDNKKYNIEETKFIKIPSGQFKNQLGVRAGIHNRRIGADNLTETVKSNIMLTGIYLGGQFTSQAYVKSKINGDAERIGAGFTRVFVDAIIFPVSTISDASADDGVKDDGNFGWRVGMQWYVSPHDGDYHFLGPSVFTTEIGMRPLSGFMFNLTWGFAILNNR
jgi:hypothetical protein